MITETAIAAPAAPVPEPAKIKPDFSSRLKPGPEITELTAGLRQGSGMADGVIYFGGKKNQHGESVLPNLEREALRYVRGHSEDWLAMHSGERGRCRPDIWPLLNVLHNQSVRDEILARSYETGQNVEATFIRDRHFEFDRAVNATRPEHVHRWHIVPSGKDGIWCIFYV